MANADGPQIADMDRALLDPGSVFAAPEDVLGHKGLSQERQSRRRTVSSCGT